MDKQYLDFDGLEYYHNKFKENIIEENERVVSEAFNELNERKVDSSELASVATTGDYNNLINKPTPITEETVAGWGFTKNTGTVTTEEDPVFAESVAAEITSQDINNWNGINNLATVATTGSYNDLTDKPTIVNSFNGSTGNVSVDLEPNYVTWVFECKWDPNDNTKIIYDTFDYKYSNIATILNSGKVLHIRLKDLVDGFGEWRLFVDMPEMNNQYIAYDIEGFSGLIKSYFTGAIGYTLTEGDNDSIVVTQQQQQSKFGITNIHNILDVNEEHDGITYNNNEIVALKIFDISATLQQNETNKFNLTFDDGVKYSDIVNAIDVGKEVCLRLSDEITGYPQLFKFQGFDANLDDSSKYDMDFASITSISGTPLFLIIKLYESSNDSISGYLQVSQFPNEVTEQTVSNWGFVKDSDIPEGAVASSATPLMDGVASVGESNAFARGDHRHPTDTSRAPLTSPALTGTPTAPTAATGTNTTQIATTAFVQNEIVDKYEKPSTGIPSSDLSNTVQASLNKADTALQSFTETDPVFTASVASTITSTDITNWNNKTSNSGTITGITMNGSSKGTSGVVDLGTVITEVKTINNQSIIGSGNLTISGGTGGDTNVIESITFNGNSVAIDSNKNAAITYTAPVTSVNSQTGNVTISVPTKTSDLQNDSNFLTSHQDISGKANISDLATVATSGSYNDLSNKPTIPAAPGTLNTNNTTTQSVNSSESLSGTIKLHKVSKTGNYNDLLNKPTIPDVSNYVTSSSLNTTLSGYITNNSNNTIDNSWSLSYTDEQNFSGEIDKMLYIEPTDEQSQESNYTIHIGNNSSIDGEFEKTTTSIDTDETIVKGTLSVEGNLGVQTINSQNPLIRTYTNNGTTNNYTIYDTSNLRPIVTYTDPTYAFELNYVDNIVYIINFTDATIQSATITIRLPGSGTNSTYSGRSGDYMEAWVDVPADTPLSIIGVNSFSTSAGQLINNGKFGTGTYILTFKYLNGWNMDCVQYT